MTEILLKIFDGLQRRKRLTMALLFALTGALIVLMSTITYNENINDFIPLSGNEKKALALYQDISGGQRVVTLFHFKDSTTDDRGRLTTAIDTFAHKLTTGVGRHHIKQLTTQVDYDKILGINDFVYANMPLLLNDSDYEAMERKLADKGFVGSQLANDAQMMMMPATSLFSTNIGNDPLGLFAPVMERLQGKQSSMAYDIDNGYIFTMNGRYAVAIMTSPYGTMESANNALLAEYIDSVASATMKGMPDVVIESTGAPIIAVGNAHQIKQDSVLAIAIAVTLILALLIYSFRSWKGLLLIGVSIVFGWLFAMGCMAGVKGEISIIVLGIGSIIIGIAVNYPLHFVAHTAHGGSIREVLKDMIAPLLIGNITTVGAFAALIPLDAPALHDLGLFAAFMLVGTILFVIIFLPQLVKSEEGRVKREEERLSFGKLAAKSPENHRWILGVIAIATLIFGYFSLFTSFDSDMHHINYMSPQQTGLLTSLQASTGVNDTSSVYIVAEGKTWDEALATRQALKHRIDSLCANGVVDKYTDITYFLNSKIEQQRRIDRWNGFWLKHRQEVLSALASEASAYGFSDDAFDGFRAIVDKQYSPLCMEDFKPLTSTLLATSMSKANGDCSVVDILHVGKNDIDQVKSSLNEEIADRGYAFEFMGMNSAIANNLSDNFNYIGYACGLIVFFFLWLSMGRLELALLSFLPMALGWVWILGIMEMCGMQFNIVNIILATFIFGQGDDYTIFMTEGLIDEYGYRRKLLPSYKNSIVISALIMFIGMGSLIVAEHPALHSLAEVTIVGMFTVVLMAWLVPPLIFGWLVKDGNKYRRVPVTMEQLLRTTYSAITYLFQLAYGCLFGVILSLCGRRSERLLHKLICRSMRFDVKHMPGVKTIVRNSHGEDFSRGSICICNHQSMLDPIFLLSLSPNMLIIVGERVWNNPIVHQMFKFARFINVGQPTERFNYKVSKALADGYNVIFFTEAARSSSGRILRFHKGAFELALQNHADILPLYLHGIGDVMPKDSGFGSRGRVTIEIGKRISSDELSALGDDTRAIARAMRRQYIAHYQEMTNEIEDSHYFHHYIIYKYIYKGISVERETKRLLKRYDDYSKWVDIGDAPSSIAILDAGKGQLPLIYALVHPETEVHSYAFDSEDVTIASCVTNLPKNLHIHYAENMARAKQEAKAYNSSLHTHNS